MEQPSASVNRRTVLASLATGASAGTGGCLDRMRSMTGWQSPTQVSLRIRTLPNDADPYALRIARNVAGWFRSTGIDAQVSPMDREALFRNVLLNGDFDLFVAQAPGQFRQPDALYTLLHSRFSAAPGWQNPFGYTNLEVDELLEEQRRRTGTPRREAVHELQRHVTETQPFSIVGFPDAIRTVRSDRFTNWGSIDLGSPIEYFALEWTGGGESDSAESGHLRLVATDGRPTENLNPLAVEFRGTPDPVDFLYDSLGTVTDQGSVEPWVAESWSFPEKSPAPVARVRLREGVTWHDGESLTASDVAFTHAFLDDTSVGSGNETADGEDDPIPAPRFRGPNSLVSEVRATDGRTVEFHFVECAPNVAVRAFTAPVLPEHVWADRTGPASVGGIQVGGGTEALVTNNIPPVGSGPLSFVGNTPRESLVLEAFDDHFLFREDATGLPAIATAEPPFDRLTLRTVGSDVTAVEVVANGEADATWSPVGAATVSRIGRASDLDLLVRRSDDFYLVGYNARRPPLTNPRFRRVLAGLIDKAHVADEVFDDYVEPAASPLAGTTWLPADLRWESEDPVTPFLGSDGSVDVERARDAFREVGYRYDDGQLVVE